MVNRCAVFGRHDFGFGLFPSDGVVVERELGCYVSVGGGSIVLFRRLL